MEQVKDSTALARRLDVGALVQQAIEHNAGVETLERLLAVAKDVRAENARAAWHAAMAAFQADVPEVVKSKTASVVTKSGARYTYKYAPLQDLITAVRPKLSEHGLSVVFQTEVTEGRVMARCLVAHEDGHVQACEFSVPVDVTSPMNPAQQVASACTYARRYAYLSALGLAPEDDDDAAEAGSPVGKPAVTMPRRSAQPPREEEDPFGTEPSTVPGVAGGADQAATAGAGGNVWTGEIEKTTKKTGKTGSREWVLFSVVGYDGFVAGTFDVKIAEYAETQIGKRVEIAWEATDRGNKNVVEIRAL